METCKMSDLFFTIGEISDKLHEPPARIDYIIRKYHLKPRHRVGIIRLFDAAQIEAIRQELYGIQTRGGHGN